MLSSADDEQTHCLKSLSLHMRDEQHRDGLMDDLETLQEEKLKDKFEGDDKDKIEKAVQETLDWLDKNQLKKFCFVG